MPFGLPSELASVGFLSMILAAALVIAGRNGRPPMNVLPAACVTLALQALHVGEEFAAGFHLRAPAMLGLQPWSPTFFVWVNVGAIAAWLLAFREIALGRGGRLSTALLWFLALASIGNGLWHPAASLFVGGYFPGTITAPFLGVAGYFLTRHLSGAGEGEAARRV